MPREPIDAGEPSGRGQLAGAQELSAQPLQPVSAIRHLWPLVALCAILSALLAAQFALLAPEAYTSQARVRLLAGGQDLSGGQSDPARRLANAAELMSSDAVVGAAAKRLGQRPRDVARRLTVTQSEDADVLTVEVTAPQARLAQRTATEVIDSFLQKLQTEDVARRQSLLQTYQQQLARLDAGLARQPAPRRGVDESPTRLSLLNQIATVNTLLLQTEAGLGDRSALAESISAPLLAETPSSPGPARTSALGLLAGLLLGLALAVLVDLRRDPIHSRDSLARLLPSGASVLLLSRHRRRAPQRYAEQVRALAAFVVRHDGARDRAGVVAVSSAGSDPGVGQLVESLAGTLAGAGQRVVVVQTNAARPAVVSGGGLAKVLVELRPADVEQRPPASSVDVQRARGLLQAGLCTTRVPGVWLLPAGFHQAHGDLLAGDGMRAVLEAARELAHVVILEVASAPQKADLLTLAPMSDALVLLVRRGRTRRSLVLDLADRLTRLGRPVDVALLALDRRGDRANESSFPGSSLQPVADPGSRPLAAPARTPVQSGSLRAD